MQPALKARSSAWSCCWAELKSTSRRASSRSRNSLARIAPCKAASRMRGGSPAMGCELLCPAPGALSTSARLSDRSAVTTAAPRWAPLAHR
eukprot:5985877-Pleurochrysis_carterae.AAC.1